MRAPLPVAPEPPRAVRASRRAFAMLLRLYPAPFRESYGDEMAELFERRVGRAAPRGAFALVGLWRRTALDMLRTAAAERLTGRSGRCRARSGGARRGPHDHPRGEESEGMSAWTDDLLNAARRAVRTPFFTLAASGTLAVGIGLTATVFSAVDAALLRPPPFRSPEEVVTIFQDSDDGEPASSAYPAYLDIAALPGLFSGVAAASPDGAFWQEGEGTPTPLSVVYATASYFPVLGLEPSLGRWFTPEHDQVGSGAYAVLTHRAWRTRFGADPAVLGRSIRLNGQPVTIMGVGPERFNGPGGALAADVWLSISATVVGGQFRVDNLERRQDHWYDVVARLAPGVGVAEARTALDALAVRMGEANPELDRGRGLTLYGPGEMRLHPQVDAVLVPAGFGVLLLSGLVLLLAASNVASLLLVRGAGRAPEIAVRRALGAGRARVARLLIMESLLLATLGGVGGLLLARFGTGLIPHLPLPLPDGVTLDAVLDGRVVLFAVVLSLLTGLFCGVLPGLRASGPDLAGALREDSRTASASRRAAFPRRALLALQVAISLVLLVGSGFLVRSVTRAQSVDPGVEWERLAVLGVNPSQMGTPAEEAPPLISGLMERIGAQPGVTGVALTTRVPAAPGGTTTTVVDGYEPAAGTEAVEVPFAYVSPSYFDVVGVDLVAGRTFGADDRLESPRVVIVNEAAAERFWGGAWEGRRVRPQGAPDAWREVVGVVANSSVRDLGEPPTPMIYFSSEQVTLGAGTLLVRTAGDPALLLEALGRLALEVSPGLAPTRLVTFEAHLGQSLAGPRVATLLLGAFSLLALLIATVGVHAAAAAAAARRSAEIAVRVALGASRARVMALVVGDSLLTVAAGVALGLVGAHMLGRGLSSALFGVGALDPAAFGGGAALLLFAAGVAALIPAWRASRADPAAVLQAR